VSKRVSMTVTMSVTPAQGLALQAMFEHWNFMDSAGMSRMIAFYVDGDGNFRPNAQISFSEPMPALTDEFRKISIVAGENDGNLYFDFDPIAWKLNHPPKTTAPAKDGPAEGTPPQRPPRA